MDSLGLRAGAVPRQVHAPPGTVGVTGYQVVLVLVVPGGGVLVLRGDQVAVGVVVVGAQLANGLTQSSTSRCLLLTRVTTSPSASTRAMMLPTTGKAPATDLMRSRVTLPPLTDCSQASNSAAPRPTSLASMVLSGATATWGSRGLVGSVMPALPGSAGFGPDCSTKCLDSSPQWNGQSTCQGPQLFTVVPEPRKNLKLKVVSIDTRIVIAG